MLKVKAHFIGHMCLTYASWLQGSEAGQLISADVSRDPGAVELDLNDDHTAPTQLSLRRQVRPP